MKDIISSYLDSSSKINSLININEISKFVEAIKIVQLNKNKLLIVGNGGSASTASHFATDLGVGTLKVSKPVRAISLTDNSAIITAVSNDINFASIFSQQIEVLAEPNDLLVLISASGNSSNLISAYETSKKFGMASFSLTGFDGGKLRALMSENNIHVPTKNGQYGLVEDAHLAICHIATECIRDSN